MAFSDDDYINRITELFSDLNNNHPVRIMFSRFSGIVKRHFTSELSNLFPHNNRLKTENLGESLKKNLESLCEGRNKPLEIAVIPAGPFGQGFINGLDDSRFHVTAFFDNFKTGDFDTIPIRHPSAINEYCFDRILVLTPGSALQVDLKKQLMTLLPEKQHEKIMLLGDIHRINRFDHIENSMERRVNEAVEHFQNVSKERKQETVVIAMKCFPTHYTPLLKELRQRGHAVALIADNHELGYGSTMDDIENEADLVYCCHYNALEFLTLLSRIKGNILITSDHLYDNPLMLMVRALWKGRMVHEVYDLNDNMDHEPGLGHEMHEKHSGYNFKPVDDFAREELYRSVDGILYRESPRLAQRMKDLYGLSTPIKRFAPYYHMDDKLSDDTGCPHLVYCGSIPYQEKEVISVGTLCRLASDLADQAIHMHFYNPGDPQRTRNIDLINLDRASPFVHYYKPIEYREIRTALKKFDWGSIMFYINSDDRHIPRYKDAFSSMLLTYLASGLPVICAEEIEFMAELITEHGVGIVVSQSDIKNLRPILDRADMESLQANVRILNKTWNMKTQYDPLISFLRKPQ